MFKLNQTKVIATSNTLPIECAAIHSPYAVVLKSTVRIYMAATIKNQTNIYFVDVNKNNLEEVVAVASKPIMSLGDKGCFDEEGITSISILSSNDKTTCYFSGYTLCESVPYDRAIGIALSNDNGNSFQRIGDGPVVSYSRYEPFVIDYPRVIKSNDEWLMTYTSGEDWYEKDGELLLLSKIRTATSKDGIEWVKKEQDIVFQNGENQFSPDIFYHEGVYHLIYNFTTKGSNRVELGYASSSDFESWERKSIELSESESILNPHIVNIDNSMYLLYVVSRGDNYELRIAALI